MIKNLSTTFHTILIGLMALLGTLNHHPLAGNTPVPVDTVPTVNPGPYTVVGNKLEITKESSLPDGGDIKETISTDEPKVTFSRWDGEVAMGVKSLDLPPDTASQSLPDRVEWISGDVKMEAILLNSTQTIEDGGMEINLVLNSPPTSNIFTFQLNNWENLDFLYQPPLTQEEIKGGATRPDNVVGSYAVYYRNHKDHIEGRTNYGTGKAFHIFRPRVSDANGQLTWADMFYDNGILSVVVPKDFLNTATYPVKIDPTFGYTSLGATNDCGATNTMYYGQLDATSPAGTNTLTNLTFGEGIGCNASAATVKLSLYTESASAPNSRQVVDAVAWSITHEIANTNPVAMSFALVASTQYWVGVDEVTGAIGVRYDTGGSHRLNFQAGANSPASAGSSNITTTAHVSVYATYTATASASNPPVFKFISP